MLAWLYKASAPDSTFVQLLNILAVSVAELVLNKGTLVNAAQPLNINLMLSAADVSNNGILVSAVQL